MVTKAVLSQRIHRTLTKYGFLPAGISLVLETLAHVLQEDTQHGHRMLVSE